MEAGPCASGLRGRARAWGQEMGEGRWELGVGCGCVDVWIDTHELRKKCEYPRANGKRLLRLIILD